MVPSLFEPLMLFAKIKFSPKFLNYLPADNLYNELMSGPIFKETKKNPQNLPFAAVMIGHFWF